MKICPNGHEVSDVAKFCPKCGAELHESIAEEVRFCKKCGNERKGAEKFCSHCGTPFYGDQTSLDMGEVAHGSSFNKKLVFFLILVPLILFGGYFVNNHIQEKKRIEKEQIEDNERAAEIERKRIEDELAKPSNIFNNLLSQNQNKWIGKNILDVGYVNLNKNRVFCLYFYPMGKNSGQVSFVDFSSTFDAYSMAYSCKVPYTIQDDYIIFTARYNNALEGNYELDDFMLQIQPTGNNVRLVRTKKGKTQVFDKFTQNISDPIK